MNINIKNINDYYCFDILDQDRVIFSSNSHFYLIPFLKSGYKYAWEAARDAWKMSLGCPYHIESFLKTAKYDLEPPMITDVSAEQMLVNHYFNIFRNLRVKSRGIGKDKEDREKVYKEIKMVISEMKNIVEKITNESDKKKINKIISKHRGLLEKYFKSEMVGDKEENISQKPQDVNSDGLPMPKIASFISRDILDVSLVISVLDEYAQRACFAIQELHKDCYYVVANNKEQINIIDFSNEPIISIGVNEFMNISSIVPKGNLVKINPIHSVLFYQKYFKSIVDSIGHFCIGNQILITTANKYLPDFSKGNSRNIIYGWDIDKKCPCQIYISFRGEEPIWFFEQKEENKFASSESNVSRYSEKEYLNSIVKCKDKNLESIYGRTGAVLQVMPHSDIIEIDVDFGRGLGVVRLTEKQVEIVLTG